MVPSLASEGPPSQVSAGPKRAGQVRGMAVSTRAQGICKRHLFCGSDVANLAKFRYLFFYKIHVRNWSNKTV